MTPKIFLLCFLFCLITPNLSIPIERILKSSYVDINASKDGHVHFSTQKKFAVHVDLDYNVTLKTASRSVKMLLALYTSKSLLASSCVGFDAYALYQRSCKVSIEKTTTNFLNFEVGGHHLNTNVFLDYNHWALAENAILGTICHTNGTTYTKSGLWGIIGLGFESSSKSNFLGTANILFSVYVKLDGMTGELSFSNDTEKAVDISSPDVVLSSSQSWHVSHVNGILFDNHGNTKKISLDDYSLIFDLNSDAIGLPKTIYKTFITKLQEAAPEVHCNADLIYKPTCKYSGKVDDLPVIKINIGTDKVISIPPLIYVSNMYGREYVDGSMILNIKATSSELTENNYVTSEFENTIVLDSNVLTYYYTIFSRDQEHDNNGRITLYRAHHDLSELPSEEGSIIVKVLVGILILGVAIGIWVVYRKRKYEVLKEEEEHHGNPKYKTMETSLQPLAKWL